MLTTVAVLVIVLGLMVSLARHVRDRSAEQLTRDLLTRLDEALRQYLAAQDRGGSRAGVGGDGGSKYPPVTALVPAMPLPDENVLQTQALVNNRDLVGAFQRAGLATSRFGDLPISHYDAQGQTLRDAWGTPLVFMPPRALNPGIEPQDRAFFISAGRDRHFSSKEDNLYSYEIVPREGGP